MSVRILLKRLGIALVTLSSAVLLTFILLRMTPGSAVDNWARQYAIQYNIPLEEAYRRIALMINYNPKEPILQQLGRYLNGLLHGNLGVSMIYQQMTVNQVIVNALPWTIFVLTISLMLSFFIGTSLGTLMAWKRKTILDPIISIYSIITTAVPFFIIAILILVIFAFQLGWFPINGAYDPWVTPGFNMEFITNALYHACLPVISYVIGSLGYWILAMKGSAVNVLGEDYINAAWARGVPEKKIMQNYVKKNAMLPLITSLALQFGGMLGGAVLLENYFAYPGMGYYIAQATMQRDYTLMQGLLLITSLAVIIANLLADLIYARLDPRVKMEE